VPKKFKVDITKIAEADVAEIWEYIAQGKPERATAFVRAWRNRSGCWNVFLNGARRCRKTNSSAVNIATAAWKLSDPLQDHGFQGDHPAVLHGARLLDTGMLEGLEQTRIEMRGGPIVSCRDQVDFSG